MMSPQALFNQILTLIAIKTAATEVAALAHYDLSLLADKDIQDKSVQIGVPIAVTVKDPGGRLLA
jgi:hypothetical protein